MYDDIDDFWDDGDDDIFFDLVLLYGDPPKKDDYCEEEDEEENDDVSPFRVPQMFPWQEGYKEYYNIGKKYPKRFENEEYQRQYQELLDEKEEKPTEKSGEMFSYEKDDLIRRGLYHESIISRFFKRLFGIEI